MAANQVALCESTGSPVMAVFQTLSAGNAGHFVPGSVTPTPTVAEPGVVLGGAGAAKAEAPVPATTVAHATDTATVAILRDREPPLIVFLLRRVGVPFEDARQA
jgi:hypothetical protein